MAFTTTPVDTTLLDSLAPELCSAPHWYVGFSGGLDSSVLLHLLHSWHQGRAGLPGLTAVHVNHGMQAAAERWQAHCAQFCAGLGVPLQAHSAQVAAGGSRESAARSARYAVFEELLRDGGVLFLAHHLDDQVETFFLRLLRGAGVDGLAAMPARRPLGGGELLRPLLQVPRASIAAYGAAAGLAVVDDPSNDDTGLDRNYLRHRVLPLLAERWPGYRATVGRAGTLLAASAGLLREEIGVPATVHSVTGDPGLPLAALLGAPERAATALRGWLHSRGCRAPDRALLAEFLRQLRDATADARPLLDCGDYRLQRYRDGVFLLPAGEVGPPETDLPLGPGQVLDVPGVGRVALRAAVDSGLALGDGELVSLRWRRGGEQCRPLGRTGTVPLKKLLQECQVPPWWRDRVPLLYLGEELLTVADLAPCQSSRWSTGDGGGQRRWQVTWDPLPVAPRD